MVEAIIIAMVGFTFGGFLACITCSKEAYDEDLVCWDAQTW